MAFKYIKSKKPNIPIELFKDNLKEAKKIKEKVEQNQATLEEKNIYNEAKILKNKTQTNNLNKKNIQTNITLEKFITTVLQHENLLPKQTPFLITNEEMKNWNTIHGFEIDHVRPTYEERLKLKVPSFIFLKNPQDVYPAVATQFKNYAYNPHKYKLPPVPTIKDAIFVFDQSNPNGKIKYIQQKIPNININAPLSSLLHKKS